MLRKAVERLFCGTALFFCASAGWAQESTWAEQMFDKTSHDFGVVARGADAHYRLAITNKYAQPVHIAEVRTSCGCTAAQPSQNTIQSRETAYLTVTMNTLKFTNQKDSSVTIVFDAPMAAEVVVPIRAFIRTDVVLTPGGATFGPIPQGAETERKVSIYYAGRPDWSIQNVIARNPNIKARVVETGRGEGRVNYDLFVSVKSDAAVGDLREQLALVTDDPNSAPIPVMVEGRVEPEYTVTPDLVSFGTLPAGTKKTVNVVVRGRKPFTIQKIESDKQGGAFDVKVPSEAKPIHVLTLTLNAPADKQVVDEKFTVTIEGGKAPIQFRAYGKIPTTAAQPTPTVTAPSVTAK